MIFLEHISNFHCNFEKRNLNRTIPTIFLSYLDVFWQSLTYFDIFWCIFYIFDIFWCILLSFLCILTQFWLFLKTSAIFISQNIFEHEFRREVTKFVVVIVVLLPIFCHILNIFINLWILKNILENIIMCFKKKFCT